MGIFDVKVGYEPDPSAKYRDIDPPNKVMMARAAEPPNPVLPRRNDKRSAGLQRVAAGSWPALKDGTLMEHHRADGCIYLGEMMVGRAHGYGQLCVPVDEDHRAPRRHTRLRNVERTRNLTATMGSTVRDVTSGIADIEEMVFGSSKSHRLLYEGQWVDGLREGEGTQYYKLGETYNGEWEADVKHGAGRMEYRSGDVYEGEWRDDHRHGVGTMFYAKGDVFVGSWMNDVKEGIGALFWATKGSKYEGEWSKGRPVTGAVARIEPEEVEALQARDVHVNTTVPDIQLPDCGLKAPEQVVYEEVRKIRIQRSVSRGLFDRMPTMPNYLRDKVRRPVQLGTFPERILERLRHSFTLVAGNGGGPLDCIRQYQLREVLARGGLHPESDEINALLGRLAVPGVDAADLLISKEDFLREIHSFRLVEEDVHNDLKQGFL